MAESIGGIDFVLTVHRAGFDPRAVLHALRARWPDGVFQGADDEGGRPLTDVMADGPPFGLREFFVYRNQASADSWQRDGRTDANAKDVVHVLIRDDPSRPDFLQVTLVVEELGPEMASFHSEMRSAFDAARPTGKPA